MKNRKPITVFAGLRHTEPFTFGVESIESLSQAGMFVYTFEDGRGNDAGFGTQDSNRAREFAREHNLRLIIHEFEFTSSKLVKDHTRKGDEAVQFHRIFDLRKWKRARTPLWEQLIEVVAVVSALYVLISGTLYILQSQRYWLVIFEFLYLYAVAKMVDAF